MNNYMRILREAFIIAAVAAVIGFAVNMVHPRGYVFVPRGSLEKNTYVYISLSEAKIKFDSGIALFVDARAEDDFAKSHVPGALNIPAIPEEGLPKSISANESLFKEPLEIVVYCSDSDCDMSDRVAEKITASGYKKNIYIFKSGFSAWESKKYPLNTQ